MKISNETDVQLLSRLREGDGNAFKKIYLKFYEPLCFFILSYTHDKATSEDIVHDILTNMWSNQKELNIHTSLKSYLFSACYHRFIDKTRRDKRQNDLLENIRYQAAVEAFMPEDEEDTTSEKINQMNKIIDSLPPKCREIFLLSKMKGLKYREIADQLNISIKTVETQIGIAYTKLRESKGNN